MAEDYYNGFDYYNAEPPRESATPPPEEAAAAVPEDEYNEKVHESVIKRRKSTSVAVMLALSGLAVSFAVPGLGLTPSVQEQPGASTVIESTVSGSDKGGPTESSAVTSAAPTPTPTPAPTPTPVPLPTEDLNVRLDSFDMYKLDKGYLAEIRFTLATNSGIKLSSISGAIDADLFIYDGYNAKTNKVKSHREKYHQDFTVESAKLVTGTGVNNTEMQYTTFVNVPVDASSEDKFSVTLTVSNTLNGEKTEDKTVSLKDIALWNEKNDTHVSSTADIKTVKNGSSFELTVTPKAGVTVKGISLSSIDVFAKKGATYLKFNDFKYTIDGNTITITPKKKKLPSKGNAYINLLVKFEMTDSAGNTITGNNHCSGNLSY